MTDAPVRLGVIGGSGLYQLAGLRAAAWVPVETPWGAPSDSLLHGYVGDTECVFLPRHGRGHVLAPHEINYRANIAALKQAGCTHVVAVSACGSFRKRWGPGTFVVVDQYRDFTRGRAGSFFGDGVVAHVGFARPTCVALGRQCEAALSAADVPFKTGAVYAIIEGPRFSSIAESHAMRDQGCDLVGMTGMPEAALAREAELHCAAIAMVTDYDAWHPEEAAVDVAGVIDVVRNNADNARRVISELARNLATARPACETGCAHALDHAIITDAAHRPATTVAKLHGIAGRVLG